MQMILYYQYRLVIFNKMDLDYCTFKYYYHHPRNVWTKGHLVDSQFIIPMWTMWWWHTFGDTLILELHHKSSFIPQAHEIKEVNMTKNTCYFSKLTTFFLVKKKKKLAKSTTWTIRVPNFLNTFNLKLLYTLVIFYSLSKAKILI